mmetsp:Transcript_25903/g.31927  ORF Transcript_25903/g.31927 Transcript_25903/m.31927 type:complete len:157 (+) Transcript_25903:311-781(+)
MNSKVRLQKSFGKFSTLSYIETKLIIYFLFLHIDDKSCKLIFASDGAECQVFLGRMTLHFSNLSQPTENIFVKVNSIVLKIIEDKMESGDINSKFNEVLSIKFVGDKYVKIQPDILHDEGTQLNQKNFSLNMMLLAAGGILVSSGCIFKISTIHSY